MLTTRRSSPIGALLALVIGAAGLFGCSSRGLYEGLRQADTLRQASRPGDPPRTAPDVDYDRYQTERERLEREERQ